MVNTLNKTKKFRIAHIITRLDKGGSAENVLLTCIGLDKNKYNCALIYGKSLNRDEKLMKEAERKNVHLLYIPHLIRNINPLKDAQAFFMLLYYTIKGKYDIVHTHSSKAGILGRWAAKLASVPVIIHSPHGHIFYGYFNSFFTGFFILAEKITAFFTDTIITLTRKGRDDHIKLGIAPIEKFAVVRSGVNLSLYLNKTVDVLNVKRELGLPDNLPIIGSLGRFDPIKGYTYFIEAANLVLKKTDNVHFLLVGRGSEEAILKNKVKNMGIEDKITFIDWRKNLVDVFNVLDIFILSSLNEGMGKVVVEAMVCGKPVVATCVGGVPEIVDDGKTGILVPPQDTEKIKDAILLLLTNEKLREEMGKKGKSKIDYYFSIEYMIKRKDSIYRNSFRKKMTNII